MYEIIDTHCHLDMEEFNSDRDEVIERSRKKGIKAIIMPSTVKEDFENEKSLCDKYDLLFYMVGIHPHDAKTANGEVYDLAQKHLKNEKCVGIGEIGLDYHYDLSPRNKQRNVFSDFLNMAIESNVPVSIHCRDADDDMVDILSSKKDMKGVIHCFSGSEKLLKVGLDLGLYFGIGGVLTFKNSILKDVIRDVPLEFVVFETDAPYLAPVPNRGKRNESMYIRYVIEKMAEILNEDPLKISKIAFENSKKVFSLDKI